jgi:signal transduction histidine kinase
MNTTKSHFREAAKRLRDGREALSWTERRGLVAAVAAALGEGDHSPVVFELVFLLAEDPKWEVRSDVANLLMLLPDEKFAKVAVRLVDDTNAFVRNAAERALSRQRRCEQTEKHEKQGFQYVQTQYDLLEKLHGKPLADRSRKIAEQLFDQLVGVTVHEMRGTLTPLLSGASSLLHHVDEGIADPAEFRRQLVKMNDRLAFVSRLVEDMRTYAIPPPLERRRERLASIVADAVAMARDSVAAHSHGLENIPVAINVRENITVDVSRHQMLMAIANVLKNAYEAFYWANRKRRKAKITIEARVTESENLQLVVADNGQGISDVDLAEVRQFVPGRTSKRNIGTGFGLPIAKRNIAAHGGRIAVDSKENEGTRVTIELPLEDSEN